MRNFMVSPIVFPNYLFIFVVDINDVTIMIKFLGILSILIGALWGWACAWAGANASEIEFQQKLEKYEKEKRKRKASDNN